MRKNIFELYRENDTISNDINRLYRVFTKEECLHYSIYDYTIPEYVDEYVFKNWKQKGNCLTVEDFLNVIDFYEIYNNAKYELEDLATFIEVLFNFWYLANERLCSSTSNKWSGNFYVFRDIMEDVLCKNNLKAYIDKTNERVLIVEDKPEVSAVVEIVDETLALDIVKYNHVSLQGEIELKKSILRSLGAELEAKRKELETINKQLSNDIFFMLNNMNIRHNNRSKKAQSKYKEYVAKMTKKQLEKWYDELYQMILLAFLLLDNVDRAKKVKELKNKVVGGNTNGQAQNADS